VNSGFRFSTDLVDPALSVARWLFDGNLRGFFNPCESRVIRRELETVSERLAEARLSTPRSGKIAAQDARPD